MNIENDLCQTERGKDRLLIVASQYFALGCSSTRAGMVLAGLRRGSFPTTTALLHQRQLSEALPS